jgi:hypothetical protein
MATLRPLLVPRRRQSRRRRPAWEAHSPAELKGRGRPPRRGKLRWLSGAKFLTREHEPQQDVPRAVHGTSERTCDDGQPDRLFREFCGYAG